MESVPHRWTFLVGTLSGPILGGRFAISLYKTGTGPELNELQIAILKGIAAASDAEPLDEKQLPVASALRLQHALEGLYGRELIEPNDVWAQGRAYTLTPRGRDYMIRQGWG
jgi:hypothetical protein